MPHRQLPEGVDAHLAACGGQLLVGRILTRQIGEILTRRHRFETVGQFLGGIRKHDHFQTERGNDFYALCEGEQPLVMIFLPAFDHPVTREYLTHYLKTYARLRGVRLACVVRSSARTVAQATQGAEFPFPIICDAPGVLYSYLGVEQARGLRSWSFAAQRIYKTAKEQGYRYDSSAPQILPLTLVVGHLGKILFTHSGRSQTDLPEDCTAIREIAREVASTLAAGPEGPRTRCSDETLTLPDLVGWDDVDNDR